MDIKTNRFEQFVLSNDEDTHIIVFCSIENFKFLCSKILIKIQNLTVIVSFDF
jgi:hypothetical protein